MKTGFLPGKRSVERRNLEQFSGEALNNRRQLASGHGFECETESSVLSIGG
jgi:hypothetical protein